MKEISFDDLIPQKKKAKDLSFEDLIAKPDDPGVMGAVGLGFGRMADKLLQGGKQAALTVASPVSDSAKAELERMKAEQQFRDEGYSELQRQHPIATAVGESAPLMALPMGASLKAAAAIGALPGLVEYGTPQEKLTRSAAGAVGGGIGYGAGKAIGAVVSPGMKATPEAERLAAVMAKEGVPLDAAQATGNPVLQNVKAALGKIPWTSTAQANKAAEQADAFGSAVLRKFGAEGTAATPDVMADAYGRIGGNIAKASDGITLRPDDAFVSKIADVEKNFYRRLPTDQKSVIKSYLDDITDVIGKGELSSEAYQATRSSLGKLAFETDNQTVKHSAKGMQKALDDLYDRQAPKPMVEKMAKAREEYARYSSTADAVKRSRSQDGRLSPKQMYATVQHDTPGFERGAGGEWADLMRAGRQFLPDQIPNSGTPERLMYQGLLTAGSMSGLGAVGGQLTTGDPVAGAALGLGGLGLSKAAQVALNSPGLTKYLQRKILEEDQKRLLAQMGGSMGLLTASQGY